ncbi:acrylyl-CoA reductase family protein [Ornithinimicrobium cryptoxanthini]|uniref:acrylyl-CoA reductase family protein n=1 Tax=Ornithinimicrobium cryptoxanthini TaxID=2934161 RepID=UPI0021196D33|nr:acryloyl-CoA reductase [Ornithinimicrobium cryptoxanthini]
MTRGAGSSTAGEGRSLRVLHKDGAPEWVHAPLDPQTSAGDVLVQVEHSSLNYKDALAATGQAPVLKTHPLTLGIDAAGVVVESSDDRHAVGGRVVVTGFGMSESHDGGWADWIRVPGDWLVGLPEGLTGEQAMGLGTAGLTTALAIHRLEEHGLRPGDGPVAVTGASGGAGMLAVAMLAGLGHEVVAMSGRPGSHDLLRRLGAASVEGRPDVSALRPLSSARWAGAVDCVGGAPLAWLLSGTRHGGSVATFGNAAGNNLPTSVLPFILRAVNLLGVNTGWFDAGLRARLWQRMATDLRPGRLDEIARTESLNDALRFSAELMDGRVTGRIALEVSR